MLTVVRPVMPSRLLLALLLASCSSSTLGGGSPSGAAGDFPLAGTAGAGANSGVGGGGGTGGVGGVFGSPGDAGAVGVGGVGGNCSPRGTGIGGGPSINCGDSLCGNGVLDSCSYQPSLMYCTNPPSFTEQCDGPNLGAWSCASVGYASGALACNTNCTWDTTGCADCPAAGSGPVNCGDAPVSAAPQGLAMAATDSEVGLAWLEMDPGGAMVIAFARLSADLQLLSVARITEPRPAMETSYAEVAVAPLPSGWVVAIYANTEIFMHVIDAAGVDVARTTVVTPGATSGYLAARPNAGPLVGWETSGPAFSENTLHVAMVASDGRSVSPEHSSSIENFAIPHSVAFAGDAFYAATSAATSSNPYQLRLKRIETDGSFTTVIDALPGVMANVPMVVPGAGDLRVVFANNPGSVNSAIGFMLQKLDARGAALGPATPLDATNRHGQVTPLAMGADTVALLSAGSGNALEMTRIGATGAVATPAFIVAQWPPHNGYQLAMARRGSEVLVAWGPGLRGPGIRIARVTP